MIKTNLVLCVSSLGKQGQQEFKDIVSYIASARLAWAIGHDVSRDRKTDRQKLLLRVDAAN